MEGVFTDPMKTLTEQLIESSNEMLKDEPEVSDSRYSANDDGGVESQTGEFLYGLVKLLKPLHILETGTYTGISSLYMGQALKENGGGDVTTLEIEKTHKERAELLWRNCGVSEQVKCILEPSLDYEPEEWVYDLLFLDSEPDLRFKELVKFFPELRPGGYILIHDLFGHLGQGGPVNPDHPEMPNWPFGTLPQEIVSWLKTDKLRVISLPAPRGLVMFYKVKESDFKV